ncbi:MAG: glucosaminidase domain-containing protein [Micromonosporaceae bacterium]
MTGPKIMGDSVISAEQLVGWYGSVAPDGALGGAKLRTIAAHYTAVGEQEGVRGDLAFIQAVHETGFFTNSDTRINNFAGIGHYDNADSGFSYPSVEAGVMAHIQLLKKVARGDDVKLRTHPEYAPNWGGAHVATWAALAGNWATDPRYWTSLSSLYRGARRYARNHGGLGHRHFGRGSDIRPWQFPGGRNVAIGGNPAHLKRLAGHLGGYLETVELVFRRCRAARDELGMKHLNVGDQRAEKLLRHGWNAPWTTGTGCAGSRTCSPATSGTPSNAAPGCWRPTYRAGSGTSGWTRRVRPGWRRCCGRSGRIIRVPASTSRSCSGSCTEWMVARGT